MFNIGPLELTVLVIVGLVVLGPERLPGLARDAANMLRTLRELATGARQQLRDELGPEFADIDFRNLNPRTAVQRAVFGDDVDLGRLNPRNALRDAIFGDGDVQGADPRAAVRSLDDEPVRTSTLDMSKTAGDVRLDEPRVVDTTKPVTRPAAVRPRPRPTPGPAASRLDDDIT